MLNSDKSKKTSKMEILKCEIKKTIKLISEWYSIFLNKKNILSITQKQIIEYIKFNIK